MIDGLAGHVSPERATTVKLLTLTQQTSPPQASQPSPAGRVKDSSVDETGEH